MPHLPGYGADIAAGRFGIHPLPCRAQNRFFGRLRLAPQSWYPCGVTANEIIENLWQGSAPPVGTSVGRAAHVLVLCAEEYQPPDHEFPGVKVCRALLDDAEPSAEEVKAALRAAQTVVQNLARGRVCLVTCMAGLNRSGLVSGLALRMGGWNGSAAVRAVKAARSEYALSNEHFRRIVERWRPPQ